MQRSYIEIKCVPHASATMKNPFLEVGFNYEKSKFGSYQTYTLLYTDSGYILAPHIVAHDNNKIIFPQNNKTYAFVIVPNNGNYPVLKIRETGHYYLSDKSEIVYAAGDIMFKNGEIILITDQSGAYHYESKLMACTEEECVESTINALKDVGLPVDKFKHFERKTIIPIPNDADSPINISVSNHVYSFFKPKNLTVAAMMTLMVTGFVLQNLPNDCNQSKPAL